MNRPQKKLQPEQRQSRQLGRETEMRPRPDYEPLLHGCGRPGPIWMPLIPASFPPKKVAEHGAGAQMERAGQPNEVAPCYVFLASAEASYISGQVLHPNGGTVVNS
jgi:hypothetical protein